MVEKIKLTLLGTSAQIPTAKRNHFAALLTYNEENILVDCGEGTQRQFRKARLNPCKVTRILLTHSHGDHVFGLPGLISTLNASEYNKDLFIYGPRGIKRFLDVFLDLNFKRNFKIIVKEVSGKFLETDKFYLEAERMDHGTPTNAYSFVLKDKLRIDKKKLAKSKLKQGPFLNKILDGKDVVVGGQKIKFKSLTYSEKGKKISFVLDTLDNPRIVPFVKGSDLLVCESSFGKDLIKEAKEKKHLTSEQAGKIAKRAKVGELVLTHISQRYEGDLKGLLSEAKEGFSNVKISKDLDEFEV
jgi:ribonuclease Z